MQAEEAVKAQGFEHACIYRPGLLDREGAARTVEKIFSECMAVAISSVYVCDVSLLLIALSPRQSGYHRPFPSRRWPRAWCRTPSVTWQHHSQPSPSLATGTYTPQPALTPRHTRNDVITTLRCFQPVSTSVQINAQIDIKSIVRAWS